jgi:hypothetical protein
MIWHGRRRLRPVSSARRYAFTRLAILLKTDDPIGMLQRGGDLDLFVKDPAGR